MKRNLIVFGIDGGTFNIIDPLIKEGYLPNIEKIIKSGVKGILKSTYPPITAAAWVSFMTGKNPGKHGFFDFRVYDPTEYYPDSIPDTQNSVKENISTLHSSNFQGETIWDFLSLEGYEMNVVAFPMTYPAWKINGRMVSGFPMPDYTKPNTYPTEWSKEIGPLLNISALDYDKPDEFIKECKELIRREGNIILNQIKNNKGEVVAVVFSSSDFVQHYFWKYIFEKEHKYSSVIKEIYKEIDKILGEIIKLINKDTSILIMSDHGFTSYPKKYFHLNSWLLQEKYICLNPIKNNLTGNIFDKSLEYFLNKLRYNNMQLKAKIKEQISKMPLLIQKWASQLYFKSNLIDWNKTKAFRFKMYCNVEGIVINQKDRQKNGLINEGKEYENIRQEIIGKLIELKDPETGEKIVSKIFRREEIYNGEFIKNVPDIIVCLNRNYFGGLEIDSDIVTATPQNILESFSGIHDENGIFIFSGPNIKKGIEINESNIMDIAPTILYDLNLNISKDMDGKIIYDAFLESYKSNLPKYINFKKESNKDKGNLSVQDEELIKNNLKNLGYLD